MLDGEEGQPLCPVCESGTLQPFRTVMEKRYLRCGQCLATVMAPECRLTAEEERAIYALHNNEPGMPAIAGFCRSCQSLCWRGWLMGQRGWISAAARGLRLRT